MVQTSFQQESLPPGLESGDRLNRYEFERRYNAMYSLQKAELIEGVDIVVMECKSILFGKSLL